MMESSTESNYDSAMSAIDKKVIDLTSPDDLFGIGEFKQIYESPSPYMPSALLFLAKPDVSEQQKLISICSMQRLSLTNYVVFCNRALRLFNEGKISEAVLSSATNPHFSKKYIILKNYDDPAVAKMLKELGSNTKVSAEFRNAVVDISSGKAWSDVKAYLENSGQKP